MKPKEIHLRMGTKRGCQGFSSIELSVEASAILEPGESIAAGIEALGNQLYEALESEFAKFDPENEDRAPWIKKV